MPSEFLLTSQIDPLTKGQALDSGPLPRHVTIQPWFHVPYHLAFENGLQNLATTLAPVEVIGGEEALLGPDHDIPVRLIRNIGKIAHLHAKTTEVIERYRGVLADPQLVGDGYQPHVTRVNGQAIEENERVVLRSLELIERDVETRHTVVRLVLPLSGKR